MYHINMAFGNNEINFIYKSYLVLCENLKEQIRIYFGILFFQKKNYLCFQKLCWGNVGALMINVIVNSWYEHASKAQLQ